MFLTKLNSEQLIQTYKTKVYVVCNLCSYPKAPNRNVSSFVSFLEEVKRGTVLKTFFHSLNFQVERSCRQGVKRTYVYLRT